MKQENTLSLQEALNIEKEIELLESKLRSEFAKDGVQAKVHKAMGIDWNQLSRFKQGRVKFGISRMIEIIEILTRQNENKKM